ncbi:hypothetical protein ACHQM5_012446 [Ranunculus cassubicifolius]
MVFTEEEPIVTRLDRLDIMLRRLEEIKGYNRSSSSPARSSFASTTSSKTLTTDDGGSSIDDSSPRSLEKYCRPIDTVLEETEMKGSLIDRLHQVEDKLMKLCEEMEELEREMKKKEEKEVDKKEHHKHHGIKEIVKSCVKGKSKHKNSWK